MTRRTCLHVARALVILYVAWGAPHSRAERPLTVGRLGDLRRVEVRGARVVNAEDVRAALLADAPFQLASTPTAPFDEFLEVIRKRLLSAYRRAGFPRTRVDVRTDDAGQAILVEVEEGPQYMAGEIEVVGAKGVDGKRLAASILDGDPPAKFPTTVSSTGTQVHGGGDPEKPPKRLWNRGEPAPLDGPANARLTKDVERALARQGYFRPRFVVRAVAEGAPPARLVVRIEDEGPRAVVGAVDVPGLARTAKADLLKHLDVTEGMPLDADVLQTIQDKLWQSGRFWRHSLRTVPLPGDDAGGRSRLTIEVEEHEGATPVGRESTPEETAVLRCRDWVERSIADGADIVFEVIGADARGATIVNARRGLLMRLAPQPPVAGAAPAAATPADAAMLAFARRADAALVLTPERTGFYDVGGGRRFTSATGDTPMIIEAFFKFAPTPDPKSQQKEGFFMGGGVHSRGRDHGAPPVKLDLTLAPVCFINFLYREGAKADVSLTDGVYTLTLGRQTVRFEEKTGRLIEYRHAGHEGVTLRTAVEHGAMEREIRQLDGATRPAGVVKAAGGEAHVTGAEVLAAALAHVAAYYPDPGLPAARSATAGALRPLLAAATTAALDQLDAPERTFEVPVDPSAPGGRLGGGPLAFLSELIRFTDDFFERLSWPWTLARESMLTTAGRAKYTNLEAGRIYASADVGPVGYLAIARAFAAADDVVTARLFAKRGLERSTPELFAKDCATLFEGQTRQARALRSMTRALRALTEADVDALTPVLGNRAAASLKVIRQFELTLPADSPVVFPPALQRALWDAGVQNAIGASLTELSQLKSRGK